MDIPRGRPNRSQLRTFTVTMNRMRMSRERWLSNRIGKALTAYRKAVVSDPTPTGMESARADLQNALKPVLTRFYTDMILSVGSEYDDGKSARIETKATITDRLKRWLDKEVGVRIVKISDSTHEQTKKWYAASDGDLNAFESRLSTHFRPFRARRIAVTETTHCMNVSLQQIAKSLSFGNELQYQWVASQQTSMREGHANADGQIRDEDGWFEVVNPLGIMERLKHPADWEHGSACNCVNCRCLAVPFYKNL